MNIEAFIAERRPVWQHLDDVLKRAEMAGDTLSRTDLHELVELYRRTCSDLNRVQSNTANPEILGYLNQLTGRAYRFVYRAAHETSVWASFKRLISTEIPATFRRERLAVTAAASAMVLGALFGAAAVLINPANGRRLIPPMFFTERPRDRVERIEKGDERIDNVEKALFFSASLYTHNIKVSMLAFSLGALTIIGTILLLFYNGMILGAIATMYILDDVPLFFFAWVGPHGSLELPAIVFSAAAGLVAGRAFLMPGNLSRAASLRRVLPSVWRMMIGTALTLVCAGIVEGSFSQFSSRVFPYPLKIAVAILLFTGLLAYLFLRGLGEEA
ncbi:MAG TPA: stage II sporulation protein M [Thermoanaerobaculia bacterium]|nr:stage II sporulation protein M [Thermoanaerobaculia bacterium]